jgi:hypothetical protein
VLELPGRDVGVDSSPGSSWCGSDGRGELVAERKSVEALLRKELTCDNGRGEGVLVGKLSRVGEAEGGGSEMP